MRIAKFNSAIALIIIGTLAVHPVYVFATRHTLSNDPREATEEGDPRTAAEENDSREASEGTEREDGNAASGDPNISASTDDGARDASDGGTATTNRFVQPLEGVVVDEPQEIPSNIFWKKMGQKLILFFTLDSVNDAQKKIEFAEENTLLAEFIAENSQNKDEQEMAAELIDVANNYVQSVLKKTDKLIEEGKSDGDAKIVFENLSTHLQNKQMLISNIKDAIDVDAIIAMSKALKSAYTLQQDATPQLFQAGTLLGIGSILDKQYVIPQNVIDFLKNDQDGDGVSDAKEDELGTNKFDFDTDHDGLDDKFEIEITKTDPKKADTDGDGFWDGYEISSGYSPLGSQKLDKLPVKPIQNIDLNTGLIKPALP